MGRFSEALRRAGVAEAPPALPPADSFISESASPVHAAHVPPPDPPLRPNRQPEQPRTGPAAREPLGRREGPNGHAVARFREYNPKLVEKLVVPSGAPADMIEEYRKLAALLHHAQLAHSTKVVMITSAASAEGKTLTAANLALTLSQSFLRNVLLIDADLRKPSVHTIFNVENAAGLIDALRDAPSAPADRKVPIVEVTPSLRLLLSGGVMSDPTALLTSDVLQKLLKDASEVFDWIIVDTPPAAFLPDCNLVSSIVDAALLVIRACATPYPLVQRAVEAIGHDKILGVVLNRTEHSAGGETYGYGPYGYGYGYGYGSDGAVPDRRP